MNSVLTATRALLNSRDRATSLLTILAFALPHAFLLAVTGGVYAFQMRAALETADEGFGGFYVGLACFAAILLVVPILSMGAAAARLGMSRRAHDLAILRLIGLSPAHTRYACVLETVIHAGIGVVIGSVLYAATLPAWGLLSFQNMPMSVEEMWVGILTLLAEGVGMIVLAALSSLIAMSKVVITPLGITRRSDAQKVSPIGVGITVVIIAVWLVFGQAFMGISPAVGLAMLLGFLALIFALTNVIGVWSVGMMGRGMALMSRSPQLMLAGRRIADDPRSVWRSFGAVALVGFLVGILYPVFSAIRFSDDAAADPVSRMVMQDIQTGMLLTFGITLALGAISTAINQSIRVIDSVDQMRALSHMGSPAGFLDRSRRLEIGIPALAMLGGAMGLGILFMLPVMAAGNPLMGLATVLGFALGGVALILAASEATVPLRKKLLSEAN